MYDNLHMYMRTGPKAWQAVLDCETRSLSASASPYRSYVAQHRLNTDHCVVDNDLQALGQAQPCYV